MTLGKLIDLLNKAKEIHEELRECENESPEYESGAEVWKAYDKKKAAIKAKQKKLYGVKL